MKEQRFDESDENTRPKIFTPKIFTPKILIITFTAVIALLAIILFLTGKEEARKEKATIEEVEALKVSSQKARDSYLALPNGDKVKTYSFLEAESSANKAKTLLNEKKYKEAKEAYVKSEEHYNNASKSLRKFSVHLETLGKLKAELSGFSSEKHSFTEFVNQSVLALSSDCIKAQELIDNSDLKNVTELIHTIEKRMSQFKSELKAKEQKLEDDWAEAKKGNDKKSFQSFISNYPHSSYVAQAKEKIVEIDKAQNLILLQEQAALKRRQAEELKQQAVVAERKAQEEKRKLEEPVMIKNDDGSSYNGLVNAAKQPHGSGTFFYANGNVYRGEWQNGQYHGSGTYTFTTGLFFKGKWKEGKRHGIGQLTWDNGDRFAGKWEEGILNGKAIWAPKKGLKKRIKLFNGQYIGFLSPESYKRQQQDMEERYKKNRLNKNQKRSYLFMKRYKAALKKLEDENPGLVFPDFPPYIEKHDAYVSGRMSPRDADKHEPKLKQLFFERKRYVAASKGAEERSGGLQSAEFGGYTITTSNLGVILDKSGSMTSFLPKLRAEINKKFAESAFMEVTGCSLRESGGTKVTEAAARSSTLLAIKYLVNEKGVDTIYWFSDLNDGETEAAIKELEEFFYDNLITFYLSSVGKKPNKALKELVEGTGGKILKK